MKRIASFLFVGLLLAACHFNIKPLPPHAITCYTTWDCPEGMRCGFPEVDTYLQCIPGGDDRWHVPPTH